MPTINGEIPTPFAAVITSNDPVAATSFTGGVAYIDFFGSMGTYQRTILVGQSSNTLPDTHFWTLGQTNGGTVTDGAQLFNISTGTNAAGTASLTSVQLALDQLGTLLLFTTFAKFTNGLVPPNNNTIEFGPLTPTDGVGFQWLNGLFGIIQRTGGVTTRITSFNIATPIFDYTQAAGFTIVYSSGGAVFYYNNLQFHAISGTIGNTASLPFYCKNTNTGSVVNTTIQFQNLTIARLGGANMRSVSTYISAPGTYILKHGPGTLNRIVIGVPQGGGLVTVYDNITATGTPLMVLNGSIDKVVEIDQDLSFGLTVVTVQTIKVTIFFQ